MIFLSSATVSSFSLHWFVMRIISLILSRSSLESFLRDASSSLFSSSFLSRSYIASSSSLLKPSRMKRCSSSSKSCTSLVNARNVFSISVLSMSLLYSSMICL